jgi:hypothetical protein
MFARRALSQRYERDSDDHGLLELELEVVVRLLAGELNFSVATRKLNTKKSQDSSIAGAGIEVMDGEHGEQSLGGVVGLVMRMEGQFRLTRGQT